MTIADTGTAAPRAARMQALLQAAFSPIQLEVADESAFHAGHAGASAAGETHYAITLVSDAFRGLSRVERSRMVHTRLKGEFDTGLHALSLKLRSPDEK